MHFSEDENFGAQIRAARALLYITQGELARAARLSIATLNEIEHGKSRKRVSTREALLQCLTSAGIHFEQDGTQEQGQLLGVFLHRTARPFHLNASVHSLLAPDALMVPHSILFYLASSSASSSETQSYTQTNNQARNQTDNQADNQSHNSLSLAAELTFAHRRVLLDLAAFDLSPLRAMPLGRFLLSAFSLYGDRLFCSEPARLPTLSQSAPEALATLSRCERRALHDPFPLLFALEEANREKTREASPDYQSPDHAPLHASLDDLLKQRDHPLARVKELIEAAQEE